MKYEYTTCGDCVSFRSGRCIITKFARYAALPSCPEITHRKASAFKRCCMFCKYMKRDPKTNGRVCLNSKQILRTEELGRKHCEKWEKG